MREIRQICSLRATVSAGSDPARLQEKGKPAEGMESRAGLLPLLPLGWFIALSMALVVLFCVVWIGTAHAEHFFGLNSTWYEPVPTTATAVTDSASYVDRLRRNSPVISAAAYDWTVPVFYAKADTPTITVSLSYSVPTGWDTVPIPDEALPDMNAERCAGQYTDGHMVVVSADRHWAWDFYQASKCNGVWHAAWTRRWDLTTDGVNQPYDGEGSCRVAKVPLLQGLITYNEVVNEGAINHAIAFATWSNAASTGWYPTYTSTVESADDTDPWANILGMRYQLDPAFNCETTGWNNFNKIVCRALQKYGMIYVENAGPYNNAIYAENLVNKPVSWDGIITQSIAIPWDKMRIVAPVYPTTTTVTPTPTPTPTPTADTTAPTAPSGLTAVVISSSRIDLSWGAATDNVGVTGYKVYRNNTAVATATALNYSDLNLSPSTAYQYTVSAIDAAGNESAKSGQVPATTLSDAAMLDPVRVVGVGYYGDIATAYASAGSRAIDLQATDIPGTLAANRNYVVTLRGGYDGIFVNRSGMGTVITGPLVVSSGTVILDEIGID